MRFWRSSWAIWTRRALTMADPSNAGFFIFKFTRRHRY